MSDWASKQERDYGDGLSNDYEEHEFWYPVFAEELSQTIHDCDVVWRYQGIIQNSVSHGWSEIEDLDSARAECKRLNDIIDGYEV